MTDRTLVSYVFVLGSCFSIQAADIIVPGNGSQLAGLNSAIKVPGGGALQAALDNAVPGDNIILTAGATYIGNFNLAYKGTSTQWITIQSANLSSLPRAGSRVSPSDAVNMPKIVSVDGTTSAFTLTNGAHHYRFLGIEVTAPKNIYAADLIRVGTTYEAALSALPHDVDFDRVYIHGDPVAGAKRGIALNGATVSVRNSYISDIKSNWQDTQALMGWNGPGPFLIENNFLEAAAENVLFGGATPTFQNMIPSNITIRGNYFFKPFSWYVWSPTYDGGAEYAKNMLELKIASNVLIDGNIFQNNWIMGQNGYAIQLTVRTENGTAPWAVVQDVTFTHNIIQDSANGVDILGKDDANGFTGQTQRITFRNNLLNNTSSLTMHPAGPVLTGMDFSFTLLSGTKNVTIDHNTTFPTNKVLFFDDPAHPHTGLQYTNNLTTHGLYGIFGGGYGPGTTSLAAYAPGSIVNQNAMIGGQASAQYYPAGNYFPPTTADVGFTNYAGGNFSLLRSSPYHHLGTDGADLGADMSSIASATATAVSGQNTRYSVPAGFSFPSR